MLAWPAFRKQRANPHAALLARELIGQGVDLVDWTPLRALLRPGDLWHLHHPETVLYRRGIVLSTLETVIFLVLLALARVRRVRVLWTIHDLGSNDGLHPGLEAWFWKAFVPRVDAIVCLSERSRDMAFDRFPDLADRPAHVVPHGHYLEAYPQTVTHEAARERLALAPEVAVLLHFGLMRPYKNAPHLIRVFRALDDPEAVLMIVGQAYDAAIERQIRDAADGAPNVRLHLCWVAEDDVQIFFAASDLVVLPYRKIMNSGALVLALTFARPVLVPDLGSMRDQQQAFGDLWVRLYGDELTANDLRGALAWVRSGERLQPDLEHLSWSRLARTTQIIYEGL